MKMQRKLTWHVDYSDLDEAVNEAYGITDYEFAAHEESGNDESHQFYVDGKLTDWDRDEIKERVANGSGDYSFLASTILNDMASKGLIPYGDYVVNVSW